MTDTLTLYISRQATLLNALDTGGYVIYFRHAIAQTGKDQFTYPAGWHLSCQSDTARQLSPEGVNQATEIGAGLAELALPIASIGYVSEFCRCKQSAALIHPGTTWQAAPDLTFYVYDETLRHARTLSLITGLRPGRQNILIVAHSFGPGSDFPELAQGYAAVFDPEGPRLLGYLADEDFTVFRP